jgi:hypothetical protein
MFISDAALKNTPYSIQEFAFHFVLGHHEKRLNKSRFYKTAREAPMADDRAAAHPPSSSIEDGGAAELPLLCGRTGSPGAIRAC